MMPLSTDADEEQDGLFKIQSGDSLDDPQGVKQYADESDDDNEDEESNAEEEDGGGGKMQSMDVMMGDELFTSDYSRCCCLRYWKCLSCSFVLALVLLLTFSSAVEYQKEFQLLHPDYSEETSFCDIYNDNTLKLLMNHFDAVNDTSKFCPRNATNCQCKHPFQPQRPDAHAASWGEIFQMNKMQIEQHRKHAPDVVLLGDSIVEHFNGLDVGYSDEQLKSIGRVFEQKFDRKKGGKVNGLAFGIGGDRIQNLLYRLQNGEGNQKFHPRVWWILIGANDIEDSCSVDTIAAGNFRIVQEIRKYHPGAAIVLNSMLPRDDGTTDLSDSPTWSMIQQINKRLECFAKASRGVQFFNATDIFINRQKRHGYPVVKGKFMKDAVHPNAEGARLWADLIANKVVEIKYLNRKKKPTG